MNTKKILSGIWVAFAILCLIYGIMVWSVGSGTVFFIVWMGLALIFAVFSLVVKQDIWRHIPKILRTVLIAMAGVGLAVFLVIEGCIFSGFYAKGEENLDYIIVLGAQVYESGPSAVLKFRLDKAAEYLEDNPKTICIVSGGQGYNEPFAEAVGMAEYLEEQGISGDRLILETESANTEENIENSMALIDEGASVGIVTNNFHMFRAVQTAKWKGLENVCGITADTTKLYIPNNMLREFFGEVKFLLTRADSRLSQKTEVSEPEKAPAEENFPRELEAEELADYSEYLKRRDCYGFLLSSYDDVRNVNLGEVFYSGAGIDRQPTSDETEAYLQAVGQEELFTDLICIPAADMDQLLLERTGYTLQDMQAVGNDVNMTYMEACNAYFNEVGDTNYLQITCTSGTEDADGTVTLECESAMEEGEAAVMVLKCTVTLDQATKRFIRNEVTDGYYVS